MKYTKLKLILTLVVLMLYPVYLIKQLYFTERQPDNPVYEYVGKEACIECHEAEFKDWQGSDHDKSMDVANDFTVLGNFNDAVLVSKNGIEHRMYREGEKFMINTEGDDGKMHDYEVKYVFGWTPLQNYLVEFPGGRLQTLAVTWNTLDSCWYYMPDSTYKDEVMDHHNWLYWTNQAQNWNSMCAYCHSTDLKKGYDHKTDSYHTTWSEIDVSCEACHGPGSYHIKWANLPEYARKKITNYGLTEKTSGLTGKEYVDECARCHSRRSTLNDYDPHYKNIYDHIIPSLPVEPNYFIDGQIKDEDYVWGSFNQSKMYIWDVKCNDCHNVHSGKLVLPVETNELCLQCHKAEDYDTPNHTHHKSFGEKGEAVISESGVKFEVGSGTQCYNCHMHGRYYMGVDYRRDHSFRIPRPDLSEKLGTPNACNQCHADKSNKWSQNYIEKWFGISRPYQFGEAIFNAHQGVKGVDEQLFRIINAPEEVYPLSKKATALSNLTFENDSSYKVLYNALNSVEPQMRLIAVRTYRIENQKDIDRLLPMLNDESEAVRVETANKLSFLTDEQVPVKYRKKFHEVLKEYEKVLQYNADFPMVKFSLGNFYYMRKNYPLAEKYYLAALEQDSELDVAKVNIAYVYSAMGKPDKAEKYLREIVDKNPDDPTTLYNLGLVLSETKKYKESLKYLIRASEQEGVNPRVFYNIAMMYDFFKDYDNAVKYLKLGIKKNPDVSGYANLYSYYQKYNKKKEANELAKEMMQKFPDDPNVQQLRSRVK